MSRLAARTRRTSSATASPGTCLRLRSTAIRLLEREVVFESTRCGSRHFDESEEVNALSWLWILIIVLLVLALFGGVGYSRR
jgi:hypothetical protein